MKLKAVLLCNISIRLDLCLKLQKAVNGEGTGHKTPKPFRIFQISKIIQVIALKNGFHYYNNLIFRLNLIL